MQPSSGTRRAALGAAVVLALLLAHSPARAESPRVSLRWSAPESCPAGARVVAEVDRILGASGAHPATPIEAAAQVSSVAERGFRVRLETRGQGGARVREISAASCEALADATALILALMIDPAAVAAPPSPPAPLPPGPPAPLPPPAPAAEPLPLLPPAPLPVDLPRPRLVPRFHLQAWAALDRGSLPGVAAGFGGALGLSLGALRLELGGGAFPSRAALAAGSTRAGGDVSLALGSATACHAILRPGPFEIAPCVGLELGRLAATGYGVSDPGSGAALWSAGRLGALLGWAARPSLGLLLRLEAAMPFTRPTFRLENVGEVHQPGPVAARAQLGVEAKF